MIVSSDVPRIYYTKNPARSSTGKVYDYATLRYDEYDERKGRNQPKQLVNLGQVDQTDPDRVRSLAEFAREFCRKGSTLTIDDLRARFQELRPVLRLLCSRQFGFRWIIDQAWQELGYQQVLEAVEKGVRRRFHLERAVFGLVLQQLITPGSKRRAAERLPEIIFFPEGEDLTEKNYYAALDVLGEWHAIVEAALRKTLERLGLEAKVVGQDTTSIYFETPYDDKEWADIARHGDRKRALVVNDPPLRMRGHSKDGKRHNPQVVVEHLTTQDGFLVHQEVHPGNTSDKTVAAATASKLEKTSLQGAMWAADTGINCAKAQKALRLSRFQWVLGEGQARTKEVKAVLRTAGRYRQHPENPDLSYKAVRRGSTLYIIRRSKKEKAHQDRTRARQLRKIREVLAEDDRVEPLRKDLCRLLSHQTYRRYVRRSRRDPSRLEVDEAAVRRAEQVAGKSVISTEATDLDPITADGVYRSLQDTERCFRAMKAVLQARPVRNRKALRIRGHLLVCAMAYNVALLLEKKTGLSLEMLRDVMASLTAQLVESGPATFWECVELTPEQHEVFEKLGYDEPLKRFTVQVKRG